MSSASLDRFWRCSSCCLPRRGWSRCRRRPGRRVAVRRHGVLAGLLVVALVLKVRRSVPRAVGGRRWWRLGLGADHDRRGAALAAGYLWVALGEIVWLDVAGLMRWTLLTVHAWIGLVLVPLVVIHLLPRRWRLLRPHPVRSTGQRSRLLTRRSVLVGGGLLVAASVSGRRPTRSSWSAAASAGSPARAGCPPAASAGRRSSANPPRRSTLPAGACASAIGPSSSTSCASRRDHPDGRARLHLGLGARDRLAGRAAGDGPPGRGRPG